MRQRQGTSITHDGITYPSHTHLARAYGVDVTTFHYRMKAGRSINDALSNNNLRPKGKSIVVFDKQYNSITLALEAFDIPYQTFYLTKKQGLTTEQTIQQCIDNKTRHHIVVRDVTYPSIQAFTSAFGVVEGAEIRAMRRANPSLTVEQACEQWLIKRETTLATRAANKVIAENKRNERKLAAIRKTALQLIGGDATPISLCPVCNTIHKADTLGGFDWFHAKGLSKQFCSDNCKIEKAKTQRRKRREHKKENGKHCRGSHLKRAQKNGAKGIRGITTKALVKKYGMTCMMCGCDTEPHLGQGWQPKGWSVGHVVALARGGHHDWDNVWLECMECNVKKGDQNLPAFSFVEKNIELPKITDFDLKTLVAKTKIFTPNQISLF